MNNKFLKRGYSLMAALVLTMLIAAPYTTQANNELAKGPDATPNGDCEILFCIS